jgi:hypothetical protein
MVFIGMLVGGFVIQLLLSVLWERLLFSKIYDDPVKGKLSSVVAAWLTCGTLAGFGMADGGPFAWYAFVIYLLPALLLAVLGYRRGIRLREEAEFSEASVFE